MSAITSINPRYQSSTERIGLNSSPETTFLSVNIISSLKPHCLRTWRHYLQGPKFIVWTDNIDANELSNFKMTVCLWQFKKLSRIKWAWKRKILNLNLLRNDVPVEIIEWSKKRKNWINVAQTLIKTLSSTFTLHNYQIITAISTRIAISKNYKN